MSRATAGAESKAVALRPSEVIEQVDSLIEQKRDQFMSLLGNDPAVVDRMRTLTLHALASPTLMEKLKRADIPTIVTAVRECATLGLMPIPALAEGYFVPYWNSTKGKYDIQFQVGYQGLAKLIRNSGRVVDVDANVAYDGDEFDYDEGSGAFVRHKRALANRGNRIAAYAVAWLPGGLTKVRVLDVATIEQHRRASKAKDDGPWVEWYDAMAQKTALTQLGKYLPKSHQVERALMLDIEAEEQHAAPPAPPKPSRLISSIHERLGVSAPPVDEAVEPEPEPPDEPELDPEDEAELDSIVLP